MNDWTPVIAALAAQIPVLVGLLVFYVHWKIAEEKAVNARDRTIEQNKDIIKEQADVKIALNGTNHLIPKIDRQVMEVKENVVEVKNIVNRGR